MNTSALIRIQIGDDVMMLKKSGSLKFLACSGEMQQGIDRHISGHRWYNKQEKIIEFICDPEEVAQGVLKTSFRGYDKRSVDMIPVVFLYAFGDRSPKPRSLHSVP